MITDADVDLDFRRRFIQRYVAGLRDGHRFALQSVEHTDTMLTWAIGLMGAGILGGNEVFKALSPNTRALVLAPWLLGTLLALAGRLVSRAAIERYNRFFFLKVNRMELAEFYNTTADSLRDGIDPIMLHKGESSDLEKIWKAAEAHARCVNRLYYTSHILFGVGILTVFSAPLWSRP